MLMSMQKTFLCLFIIILTVPNFAFATEHNVLRASFSTDFVENPPREHNIRLAVSKFNNLVVNAGDEVSFNKVVGPRTEQNGFLEAKIIIDGEYTDGIGGGVCQVSTTVFNAVALAGLEIVESHNHSLPSYYVGLGRDAMVSAASDLRFTNNTGRQIIFKSGVLDHSVWVKIYGRTKGPQINYKLSTELEQSACAIKTYFECYKKDKLLFKKPLRKSVYKPQPTEHLLFPQTVPHILT
jgi:vancomycin resistance protein YoaR